MWINLQGVINWLIIQSVLNPCDAKMIDTIFHIVVIMYFQLCIVALNIEPLGIHINWSYSYKSMQEETVDSRKKENKTLVYVYQIILFHSLKICILTTSWIHPCLVGILTKQSISRIYSTLYPTTFHSRRIRWLENSLGLSSNDFLT